METVETPKAERTHDLLSSSASSRWLTCVGSSALIQDMIDKGLYVEHESKFAAEGTAAHAEAERAANDMFELGIVMAGKCEDADMRMHAKDWALLLDKEMGGSGETAFWKTECELPVGVVTGREGATGTADFVGITTGGRMLIADLKYGMGVEVEAELNPQLSIYALAAMHAFGADFTINSVELLIFQPRISYTPKRYVWDINELKAWGRAVRRTAQRAIGMINDVNEAKENLKPGESQCRFCPAKSMCPALREKTKELIATDFDVVEPTPKPTLPMPSTEEEFAKALPWLDTIESWCAAVRAGATDRLLTGRQIAGYKLVAGRKGARKWTSDAEAQIRAMRIPIKALYEKSLISPTKAEKLHKEGVIGPRQWERISSFISQAYGKPVMVPETDKREALSVSVADDFKQLTE